MVSLKIDGVLVRHDPIGPAVPVVFDSPHSGTVYPSDFRFAGDLQEIREAEDSHVDELFGAAPLYGAGLLCALFPRSYIDPNRAPEDLDESLIDAPWPGLVVPSEKTRLGIGLIRRLNKADQPMYNQRLSVAEVRTRIDRYYRPYHSQLQSMLDHAHSRFGIAYLMDCHSMPSLASGRSSDVSNQRADFVLGDRDGTTCGVEFLRVVEATLRRLGYVVRINDPYKGVELVRCHGRPAEGRHSLQIEVNRRLYMDEHTLEKGPHFDLVRSHMTVLTATICDWARHQAETVVRNGLAAMPRRP